MVHKWRARTCCAPPTSNSRCAVPQELQDRVLRIVRAKGDAEALEKEKPLPETPPNVLLLLTLKVVVPNRP